MKVTNIKVNGIWLEPCWAVAGTRGMSGALLKLDFSIDWEGMRRRVTFFPADGSKAYEVPVEDGEALIPEEVMACAGTAEFVIDGISAGGVTMITKRGELRVIDTAHPGGSMPLHLELREELRALRAEYEKLKEVIGGGIKVL